MAKVESFKMWCQKVLPLVYDDSLSYYEVLCKVVIYLNNTIGAVNENTEDVANLRLTFEELRDFVDNYFNSLDVQEEINNKLNTMAEDGTLTRLIKGYVDPLYQDYVNYIDGTIDVLERRMDTFASLTEGSTTGDAELVDIRVGASGFPTYPTAGDAVRGQITSLKEDLYTQVDGGYVDWLPNGTLQNGYVDPYGTVHSNTFWNHYIFTVNAGEIYKVHTYYLPVAMGVMIFNSDNEVLATLPLNGQGGIADIDVIIPSTGVKMIVNYENDVLVPTVYKKNVIDMRRFDYSNVLYSKSLGVLGDSITYGQGVVDDRTKVWGSLIALRNNMSFSNYGISGSTMGDSVDGTDTHPCWSTERYKQLQGKDYGIIWFGWNDYYFGRLGTVSQADATSFLGAYYNTLVWLIENSPETKIGVIIPYLWTYNTDPQGFSIMSLINGLKEVCDICGIPYLDLNKYNFLQSWGSDTLNDSNYYMKWNAKQTLFTSDTLHPNVKGNEYLSTIIENFMRSL